MTIIKKHYTFKSIDTRKRLITLLSLECQCYLWVCCKILICKGIFFCHSVAKLSKNNLEEGVEGLGEAFLHNI